MKSMDIEALKVLLPIFRAKGWKDAIRLLDQFEVIGCAPGARCTLQVMSYDTGEWMLCKVNGKDTYSLAHWNRIIRGQLAWDGLVRLVVAA